MPGCCSGRCSAGNRLLPAALVVLVSTALVVAAENAPKAPQPPGPAGKLAMALGRDPEAAFQKMADGKEKVGKEAFRKYVESHTPPELLTDRPPLLDRMFDRLDADRDGFLTLEEFKRVRAVAPAKPGGKPEGKRKDEPPPVDIAVETASHREIEPLGIPFKAISALRADPSGNLLACDEGAEEIKVLGSDGRQIAALKPGFAPEAIDVATDGTIYCGGQGQLAKLDRSGRVLKQVKVPDAAGLAGSETRRATSTRLRLSGIAVTDRDVFVTFGIGWHLGATSRLFRFDRELDGAKQLAENLRGCCQRCDVAAAGEVVYVAENTAHRIVRYDREGTVLGKWGQRTRNELEGFGSCCNPMNLAFDAQGALYTAESGLGRVKRYTPEGKFLGLVGYVGVDRFQSASQLAASCSNMAMVVSPDGSRVYVADVKKNRIRVLQKKE